MLHTVHKVPAPMHVHDAVIDSVVHNTAAAMTTGGEHSVFDIMILVVLLNTVASNVDVQAPGHFVHSNELPHHMETDARDDAMHIDTESLSSYITGLIVEYADRFPPDVSNGLPPEHPALAHAMLLRPGKQTSPAKNITRLPLVRNLKL